MEKQLTEYNINLDTIAQHWCKKFTAQPQEQEAVLLLDSENKWINSSFGETAFIYLVMLFYMVTHFLLLGLFIMPFFFLPHPIGWQIIDSTARSSLLPVLVIKFHWHTVMPVYSYVVYSCSHVVSESRSCDRDCSATQSWKQLLLSPLQNKLASAHTRSVVLSTRYLQATVVDTRNFDRCLVSQERCQLPTMHWRCIEGNHQLPAISSESQAGQGDQEKKS